jgi:hypothetical protein
MSAKAVFWPPVRLVGFFRNAVGKDDQAATLGKGLLPSSHTVTHKHGTLSTPPQTHSDRNAVDDTNTGILSPGESPNVR